MIKPHGGVLVDRWAPEAERQERLNQAQNLPAISLTSREESDLEMLATGAMSPLIGFMDKETYESVVETMHLPSGLPWSLPVVLSLKQSTPQVKPGQILALRGQDAGVLGTLEVRSVFKFDSEREAVKTLKTADASHPGVEYLAGLGDTYVGGPVLLLRRPAHTDFLEERRDPSETRAIFEAKKWNSVVAFQTRNPIHRAHEYLQKCALEMVDGLMVHPLMGATKSDDIAPDVRMRCYKALLDGYYPKDRVLLSVFPAAMRYAGPREAIFHSIVRKNYGCTHFIVGRDHAGVGNFYGTYEAQHIFREFDPSALDITPLFFEHAFYCKACGSMASSKTCPHGNSDHVFLSGTKVREMLKQGQVPPQEFTRAEVAQILIDSMRGGAHA